MFIYDLFHQILFYFGTVGAMLILLWEKVFKRALHLKTVLVVAGFCLFLSCFQAWVDEHHNSEQLIRDKAQLSAEREFWRGQSNAKDDLLRSRDDLLAANFSILGNTQQSLANLSNRVLEIAKPEPLKITPAQGGAFLKPKEGYKDNQWFVFTNKIIPARGQFGCDQDMADIHVFVVGNANTFVGGSMETGGGLSCFSKADPGQYYDSAHDPDQPVDGGVSHEAPT